MENSQEDKSAALIKWELLDFEHADRGRLWYTAAVCFLVVSTILFIYFKQWSLLFVTYALALAVYKFIDAEPKQTFCEVSEVGVRFNEVFYPFTELKAFAISYEPDCFLQLFLNKRSLYILKIKISPEVDLVSLRKIMSTLVPEQAVQVDILDRIAKFLKI
jgi:hypothetical protein